MDCPACGNCAAFCRRLIAIWYPGEQKPRRSHDDTVLEKKRKAEAIAHRREFNRRRRAEAEARKLEKGVIC